MSRIQRPRSKRLLRANIVSQIPKIGLRSSKRRMAKKIKKAPKIHLKTKLRNAKKTTLTMTVKKARKTKKIKTINRPIKKAKFQKDIDSKCLKSTSAEERLSKQSSMVDTEIKVIKQIDAISIQTANKSQVSNIDDNSIPDIMTRYSFRKRVIIMKEKPEDYNDRWGVPDPQDDDYYDLDRKHKKKKRKRKYDDSEDWEKNYPRSMFKRKHPTRSRKMAVIESESDEEENKLVEAGEPCRYDCILSKKLPSNDYELADMKLNLELKIISFKKYFFFEQMNQLKKMQSNVHENSVPVYADVQNFNFLKLKKVQKELTGRLFDTIMMDPPWQLSSSQPSRGVAIGYSSLADDAIASLPIPSLQTEGLLLIWVINAKFRLAMEMFKRWGYTMIDEVVWVKSTVKGKIAKGHGYYLQHSKETCLVGYKGSMQSFLNRFKTGKVTEDGQMQINIEHDVIFSERRGQSQKPNKIYELVETIMPGGCYLEIFGRRNNLRKGWVTIGNEL